MALHLHSITFDAAEPQSLARFWAEVTGYSVKTSDQFIAILAGDGSIGPRLMFLKVPEGKTAAKAAALPTAGAGARACESDQWAKNRMHVDLAPDLEAETERVLGLGAELVGRFDEYGVTWASFRDPEGNEFCIGLHEPPQH